MKRNGFTIVELLIVIVVIAVLAAITVVTYSGVQERANVTAAHQDLRTLAKQMEIFRIDHGVYPSAAQTPRDDLAEVLKAAKLYSATRANQTDWEAGKFPPKRFVFCTPQGDTQKYSIVVDIPLLNNSFSSLGKTTYYVDQSGVIRPMVFVENYTGSINASLCTEATGVSAADWSLTDGIWSNSVPASWTQ